MPSLVFSAAQLLQFPSFSPLCTPVRVQFDVALIDQSFEQFDRAWYSSRHPPQFMSPLQLAAQSSCRLNCWQKSSGRALQPGPPVEHSHGSHPTLPRLPGGGGAAAEQGWMSAWSRR